MRIAVHFQLYHKMQALCYFLWKKKEDILQLTYAKYLQYIF